MNKKGILFIFLSLLFSGFAVAQQTMDSIPDLESVKPGDTQIKIPNAPLNYRLVLKGSDHNPVIDSTGHISTPLVDTKVCLYFNLIKNGEDTATKELSKCVIVPGKFSDNGKNQKPFIIPAFQEWHGASGNFVLGKSAQIIIDPKSQSQLTKAATILQKDIAYQTGWLLKIKSGIPSKGNIFLTLNEKDKAIGDEGYYFTVDSMITISAIAYQGLFWGTRSLLQLLEQNRSIPQGVARDYPQFRVRGFILDDGRKFFSMTFLRNYVKLLSYYKMNDFQIHLNDNGFKKYFGDNWDSTYSAFRLENDTYPGLTAKDGFYTKQAFRELQQLADSFGVQIVPEIDVPAHSLAFTKAVPAIASKKYGKDHLDLHNPLTDTVVFNVFKEYLSGPNPVFTGKVVDIGTDEYAKADAEAFRGFTDNLIHFVQQYGKQVRAWGALTHAEGKTPVTNKGVTLNIWYNGYADPVEMKKLGYPLISSPDGWLYIVPAAGYYYDYLDLKMLYDKWTPSQIGDVPFLPGDPAVIGGSFAEWNDIVGNGISEQDVTDRVFPAVQVLSQKMWDGVNTTMPFSEFANLSKRIGDGTTSNILGRIGDSTHPLVINYSFDKKKRDIITHNVSYTKGESGKALTFTSARSRALLPYKEIGYNYTVSFWLNPSDNNKANATIFQSADATVKLKQGQTGKLGFSRNGYDYTFNYSVPTNIWTHIVITGTNMGTSLYVNGKLQDKLYDNWIHFNDKLKIRKVETLFFPLKTIGGFKGKIDELKVWNKVLTDEEISQIK